MLRIWPTNVTCVEGSCQISFLFVCVNFAMERTGLYLTERLAVAFEFCVRVGLLRIEDLFNRHGSDCIFAVALMGTGQSQCNNSRTYVAAVYLPSAGLTAGRLPRHESASICSSTGAVAGAVLIIVIPVI